MKRSGADLLPSDAPGSVLHGAARRVLTRIVHGAWCMPSLRQPPSRHGGDWARGKMCSAAAYIAQLGPGGFFEDYRARTRPVCASVSGTAPTRSKPGLRPAARNHIGCGRTHNAVQAWRCCMLRAALHVALQRCMKTGMT